MNYRDQTALDILDVADAWDEKRDHEQGALSQPWDTPDDEASNDVGAGWACRIGRVILVEHADGTHHSHIYANGRDAREDWNLFLQSYGS